MGINVKVSGVWTGGVVPWVYAGGFLRVPRYVWARIAGGWIAVAQMLGEVTITGTTTVPRGTNITTVAGTPQGGYGAISYSWTRISGGGLIVSGATTSNPLFSSGIATTGVFRCACTDTRTGDTAYADVTLTWT